MSNTVTSLTATQISDEILPALKLGLIPLNAFSFQVEDKVLYKGDKTTVDVVSARTAGTYSTTWASGDSTATGTTVTIGAPEFVSVHINPYTEGQPTAERFLAHLREGAYGVAKKVLQDATDLCVAANIGNVASTDKIVVTAANYDADDYADQIQMLRTKGVSGPISAIHTLSYAAAMQKDNAVQNASAYGNNTLISTGELPPILGVRSYFTDALTSTVTSENTGVIFTGKTTVAIAMGQPGIPLSDAEANAGVRQEVLVDDDTGLSLGVRLWVDANTGFHWGSVYAMYGVAFVQNAATRVVSA